MLTHFFLFLLLFISDAQRIKHKIWINTPLQEQHTPSPVLPTPEMPPLPSTTELTQSYEGSFLRVIVTLLGLVFLLIATFWILKRLGRGRFGKLGSDKSIRVLERCPLSPKSVLYLLEVENKRILICESQLEVRPLATSETGETA